MKYIKKYESFKKQNSEPVNEEFLGKLIGGIKNLFKKGQERLNKTKGGKEIEVIYQKYLKLIHDQLSKTADVDLNIAAAAKGDLPGAPGTPPAPGAPGTAPGATASAPGAPTKESIRYEKSGKIFEADANAAANAKLAVDTLKKKKSIMDQIVQKLKAQALKEMDAVLAKFGGASGNPQLSIIVKTKQDQFEMDYLNSQIAYLDAAGDKTMVGEISKRRDMISKKIEASMKEFDTAKVIEYKVGDEVIYLLKGKRPEEYNKTKKPEDQKAIVGVNKIAEINGDNFTLEDEKGEPTIKKIGKEIMGKVEGVESDKVEYKAGDNVIYKREKFSEESWKKITDEDKKKPNEGPMKDLQDKEEIGIKDLKSDVKEPNNPEGVVEFEGFNKKVSDLLGKIEGEVTEEYKVGDNVIYLKGTDGNSIIINKNKFDYNALSEEEKKNLDEGEAAKLVGVSKIEKIDGDKYFFKDKEGKEFTKIKDEIIGKTEAPKVEGQEDLTKKLGDMKTKNPDNIKKVSSYVDFIGKEENKAKVEEIDKIIGGGAQGAQSAQQ
jgi:predicted XRE-type DNA-binding protein